MLLPLPFVGDKAAFLQALVDGHPGAVAAFYDEHSGYVLRTLRSILGADEDLPDLLQEVFLRGLRGIGKLRDVERTRSWLGTIAVFVATLQLRLRGRRARLRVLSPEHTRPTHCEQPSLDARRALQEVYEVLDRIPTKERMAFTLRHVERMRLGDAAVVCQTSLSTFKRRLVLAEKRFLKAVRNRPVIEDWLQAGTRLGGRAAAAYPGS